MTCVSRRVIPETLVVQNEKRRDKDLTERIKKLLKRRDEVTKGVDLGAGQWRASPAWMLTYM